MKFIELADFNIAFREAGGDVQSAAHAAENAAQGADVDVGLFIQAR